MTLILELPPELENDLTARAAKLQIPLTEYAIRLLSAGGAAAPKLGSGAELVEYWKREGLVGTRSDISDAPAHARSIRHAAERRAQ